MIMTFKIWLLLKMKQQDWSRYQLAKMLKTNEVSVARWCKGESIPKTVLWHRLADLVAEVEKRDFDAVLIEMSRLKEVV